MLVLRFHFVVNRNIKISPVAVVGSAAELAAHALTSLCRQHVGEVEDGLLPVRILGMRACAESHRLVAGAELDVEPCDEGVHVVGTSNREIEWEAEREIGGCDGVEVQCDHCTRVGDDSLELHGVDERFGKGGKLERCVVEAVDIIPDY
jgi:hypothetical protein